MKRLFFKAALDDAEWHLESFVNEAWMVWVNREDTILELYKEACQGEEMLEIFLANVEEEFPISRQAAKILFDVCALKEQDQKISVTFIDT